MKKQNHTSQEGITLIALIITIILMLILVGVTINVALNGGLFDRANDAKKSAQLVADKEELQIATMAGLDENLEIPNTKAISDNLRIGWSVTGANGGPYICKSPNDNTFTVDINGKIIEGGITPEVADFKITVEENNGMLTITPSTVYTEKEAVEIIASMMKKVGIIEEDKNISSLEQLDIELYNYFNDIEDEKNPLYRKEDVTTFGVLQKELGTEIGNTKATEQEVMAYLLNVMEVPYTTVEEWAADIYLAKTKVLKINGVDVTQGASWNKGVATYEVYKNGIYTVELQLNEKIATETIEVGNVMLEVGSTVSNSYVLMELGITENTGTYTGTWTVIGLEGDKIKLASTENVERSVKIGRIDATNAFVKDAEGNETTEIDTTKVKDYYGDGNIEEIDVVFWSYANAVNTLNEAARNATGIPSAKSITLEDIFDIIDESEIFKDTENVYKYYIDTNSSGVRKVYSKQKDLTTGEYPDGIGHETTMERNSFIEYYNGESKVIILDGNNKENEENGKVIINGVEADPSTSVEFTDNFRSHEWTPDQITALGSLAREMWIASPCWASGISHSSFFVHFINSAKLSATGEGRNNGNGFGVCAIVYI